MIVVNRRDGDRRMWKREDLRRYASAQTRR